jgi:peptidoglycan/xylan/chitin deacetylase (PgdA/CDA1 family)
VTKSRWWIHGKPWSAGHWCWLPFILLCVAGLQACATWQGVQRSDDYAIYTLPQDTPAETLARRFLGDPGRVWVIEEANPASDFKQGQTVIIPLTEDNKGGLFPEGYQVVPILSYQRIEAQCRSSLCVSEAAFARQLKYLQDKGYRSIRLTELIDFLQYRRTVPLRAVVVTIDDATQSAYTIAYPLLKHFGFTACLGIVVDDVGRAPQSLTWAQLKEMQDAGFDIAVQSASHADLTKRPTGDTDDARTVRLKEELCRAKTIADEALDRKILAVTYPYGRYDQAVTAQAATCGYQVGFTLESGENPFFAPPLRLRRNLVRAEDPETLIDDLTTFYPVALE